MATISDTKTAIPAEGAFTVPGGFHGFHEGSYDGSAAVTGVTPPADGARTAPAGTIPAPQGLPPEHLTPDDIAWLRRLFAGRTPHDVARLKALMEAHCAPLNAAPGNEAAQQEQAAPQADAAGEPPTRGPDTAYATGLPIPGPEGLSPAAQLALLGITDDLGHLRAQLIALDMAFADLQDTDDRNALRTTADTILTHLHTIRETLDHLRGAHPKN
jgi:hypothetical protein